MDFLRQLFPKNSVVRKIWYLLKAVSACAWYRFPARSLKVIGITGTDGKTTTVEMLSQILQEENIQHLKISTDSLFLNGNSWANETKRTTLSPWQTQKLLRQAVEQQAEVAVLEVSSHAAEQNRVWGIEFDFAGITNITEEHLEDHGGFSKYAAAKKKLFKQLLKPDGVAVLNRDDSEIASWEKEIAQRIIWTSRHSTNAELCAHDLVHHEGGVSFTIHDQQIELRLPGEFHMENTLVAFGVAQSLGISAETIAAGLKKFTGVTGRLERLELEQDFDVYVDDALTPNAFTKGIEALKAEASGNAWVVFGLAGGGRDKGTRPKIGKICGDLADFVVLTDDEPHDEPPELIREDIKKGLAETKMWNQGDDSPHFWEIPDRKRAIEFTLQRAETGDVILIPGLGSYSTRSIGGKEVPWDDREVVYEILGLKQVARKVETKEVQEELGELKEKVEQD